MENLTNFGKLTNIFFRTFFSCRNFREWRVPKLRISWKFREKLNGIFCEICFREIKQEVNSRMQLWDDFLFTTQKKWSNLHRSYPRNQSRKHNLACCNCVYHNIFYIYKNLQKFRNISQKKFSRIAWSPWISLKKISQFCAKFAKISSTNFFSRGIF